jgi:hypothetical protein
VSENLGLPEDITSLSADDLNAFKTAAFTQFDTLFNSGTTELAAVQTELGQMDQLTNDIERVDAEFARREAEAAKAEQDAMEAAAKREELAAKRSALADAAKAAEPVTASVEVNERQATPRKLNPSLADAARNAPKVDVPRREPVLVASSDIPNFTSGGRLEDINALVAAVQSRANSIPITSRGDTAPRYTVASLLREHKYNLGLDATPAQVNEVLTAATNPEILVAAGGWCAPSEISYDFYNIVCEDGMLDLPTVGINRGGIRFPTSPSFADVTASQALWRWTETQDIAAITGTAQSGTKTCGRVPCPGFNEERLACDGICLTVGNLTEDAYPETIANYTRLLFAAHAHKINGLRIEQLRGFASSNSVTGTFGTAGEGLVAPVVNAIALNAADYRSRYAMCQDAVLEVLAPKWIRSAMRSDLRRRTGAPTDQLAMSDARLMELFDAENVRIQFVSDYQERTTGFPGYYVSSVTPIQLTSWPSTVEFLMWAPGTVVLGQGMRLDLGIIRDSVLNATNDYTAEWMEECWLMFKPGHEVRKIVVNICADGTTGAHDLVSCQ